MDGVFGIPFEINNIDTNSLAGWDARGKERQASFGKKAGVILPACKVIWI